MHANSVLGKVAGDFARVEYLPRLVVDAALTSRGLGGAHHRRAKRVLWASVIGYSWRLKLEGDLESSLPEQSASRRWLVLGGLKPVSSHTYSY